MGIIIRTLHPTLVIPLVFSLLQSSLLSLTRVLDAPRMNLFKYLGADTVKLGPDTKEVGLPVADHDVADVGLLEAVHHAGGHRALGQMVLSNLDILSKSEKEAEHCFLEYYQVYEHQVEGGLIDAERG